MQKMMGLMRKCIDDYHMISPGDKIAVGVSGGKDSLTLLTVLAALRSYYPAPFELTAITIDMGLGGMDFSPVEALCRSLDVGFYCKKTEIGPIIFDYRKEKNPCSMCAKMIANAGIRRVVYEQGYPDDFSLEIFRETGVMLEKYHELRSGCTALEKNGVVSSSSITAMSDATAASMAISTSVSFVMAT